MRGLEQRVERGLRHVESLIGSSGYLVGDTLTLADISVSTAFNMWCGALDKTLSEPLAAYHDRLKARPAWQRAWTRSEASLQA